jgi:hypothetical protein
MSGRGPGQDRAARRRWQRRGRPAERVAGQRRWRGSNGCGAST